jgi:hypothetical protein
MHTAKQRLMPPLRLVVSRRWHDRALFTDRLDCGHEVTRFVLEYATADGTKLPKRHHCAYCLPNGNKFITHYLSPPP